MGKKLYVGNINYDTTEDILRETFTEHGEVVAVNLITDRMTGMPRGFGFVEMGSDEDAQKAISALDGREIDGRRLVVNEARERAGGGGGGYGRR
ncbi:MAG: RNA-binding protein [Spirochaetaceae bacterium]|nr:MAG: RNA-binding protein [Spirochaetaceae bacterium]